jgi:hypothetical protein
MGEPNDYKAKSREYAEKAAVEADPVRRQEHLRLVAAFDTLALLEERWRRKSTAKAQPVSCTEVC